MSHHDDLESLQDGFDIEEPVLVEPSPVTLYNFCNIEAHAWDDPIFMRANQGPNSYRVIPLTQGFFMIVSPSEYWRMTHFPDGKPKVWRALVTRTPDGVIVKVYGRRSGRGYEPQTVYAHREVMGCIHNHRMIVDHLNGIGLDNRGCPENPVNLCVTTMIVNSHNTTRASTHGLLPGVEYRKGGRFGWKVCKRISKRKVKTIRSESTWETQREAHEAYLEKLKEYSDNRTTWACNPTTVDWPVLPPSIDSAPALDGIEEESGPNSMVEGCW